MPIWKITSNGPKQVPGTKLKHEKIIEGQLEEWIMNDPKLLGEPLLIIGRQIQIPEIRDRIDLLAVDSLGNAVIIELKRGILKDPVDMQALRYASYISKWEYKDFENIACQHLGSENEEFNFNELYEQFCSDAGVDDVPDLNTDQRLILVGTEVSEKLGSVALWLHEHNIDVKVIQMEVYHEGDTLYIRPNVIVPITTSKFKETGRPSRKEGAQLWMSEGKTWHLEKRCSPKTKAMLLKLDNILQDNFEVDGPRWNQKFYVAYRVNNYNWLIVITTASVLQLRFLVKANTFKQAPLAEKLGVEQFAKKDSYSEKRSLPSSMFIENRHESVDRITLRIKEDFDIEKENFLAFLKDVYNAFPK